MSKVKNFFLNLRNSCSDTSIFLKICFLLLGNIFLPALIASFGFILNISINCVTYILSQIILLIIYTIFFFRKDKLKFFIIPIIISLFIVILSIFISNKIYDSSVDGWGYHNPAIIKLSEGWNPLYEHFDNENELGIWSEHYPKVIWIYGATLYNLTSIFFVGYTFNIIIAFATLFLMIDIFKKKKFNNLLSITFATIASFSTITIAQLFTLYNDGVFGLCIIGLLLLYNGIINKEYKLNGVILLIISFLLSILANIKFNGALYAFLIALVYTIILFIKKSLKWDRNLIKYIMSIGLCVIVVASNTYLVNAIYHKNIGYPILGENKIEIIEQYIPAYISPSDGNIEAFAKTITSASYYEYIYNPFYVAQLSDYTCASSADCRVNGFGPLYQLLVILAIIIYIIYVINTTIKLIKKEITIKSYIKENYYKYIPFIFMAVFFLVAPATWWIRYVPFMHTVPLLIIIFFHDDWEKVNINSILAYSLIVIYLVSMVGIGSNMVKQSRNFSYYINDEIKYIQNYVKKNELHIAPIDYTLINNSFRQNMSYKYLENKNIDFIKHETYECKVIKDLDMLAISIVDCSGEVKDEND